MTKADPVKKSILAVFLSVALAWAVPIALPQKTEVRSNPVFSPGGQYLLVGAGSPLEAVWNLWDVPTGQLVQTIAAPKEAETRGVETTSASFSQDGKTLAVVFVYDKLGKVRAQVWRDGKMVYERLGKNWTPDTAIALSPDASMVVMSGWDLDGGVKGRSGDTRVVSLVDPKQTRLLKRTFREWTQDNKLIVSSGDQGFKEEPLSGATLETLPTQPRSPAGSGKLGWPILGGTDLTIRYEKLMGKGRADLVYQSSGKVIASWPRLFGYNLDPKGNFIAAVTKDGVLLIDLKASAAAGALRTL